jgi:hypothetical protein
MNRFALRGLYPYECFAIIYLLLSGFLKVS